MPEPIPQHYTTTEGGEGEKKGGFLKRFEKHGTLWLIGIGAATLIILVMYARNQSNNAANAATGTSGSLPIDPATGIPYAYESMSNAGLSGSQADSNYQALQSSENTNTALLQSILNALQGQPPTGTNPPPTNPPPAGHSVLPTPTGGSILPSGSSIWSGAGGQFLESNPAGDVQPLVGPQGMFWGVPNLFNRSGNWFYAPSGQNQAFPVVTGKGSQFTITKGIPVPPTYHP